MIFCQTASLNYVPWKERKEVAADLKAIYQAATATEAELALGHLTSKWDASLPSVGRVWRRNWDRITPFFNYPAEIRRAIANLSFAV
jgi:putative transposase